MSYSNLEALLGEKFKPEMTPEEMLTALNGVKLADLGSGKYVDAEKFNRINDKLKLAEKEASELKTAQLTEDEKKAAEEKKRAEEYEAAIKRATRAETAIVFAESGLKEEDYKDLLDSTNADGAKKIVSMLKMQTEAAIKAGKATAAQNFHNADDGIANGAKSASAIDYQKLYDEAVANNDIEAEAIYYRKLNENK